MDISLFALVTETARNSTQSSLTIVPLDDFFVVATPMSRRTRLKVKVDNFNVFRCFHLLPILDDLVVLAAGVAPRFADARQDAFEGGFDLVGGV